jgi:hypothetical protein
MPLPAGESPRARASTKIEGDGPSVLNVNVVTVDSKQDAPRLTGAAL